MAITLSGTVTYLKLLGLWYDSPVAWLVLWSSIEWFVHIVYYCEFRIGIYVYSEHPFMADSGFLLLKASFCQHRGRMMLTVPQQWQPKNDLIPRYVGMHEFNWHKWPQYPSDWLHSYHNNLLRKQTTSSPLCSSMVFQFEVSKVQNGIGSNSSCLIIFDSI